MPWLQQHAPYVPRREPVLHYGHDFEHLLQHLHEPQLRPQPAPYMREHELVHVLEHVRVSWPCVALAHEHLLHIVARQPLCVTELGDELLESVMHNIAIKPAYDAEL